MKAGWEERKGKREPTAEFDGEFAFIAGYTKGSVRYGTTWDELLAEAAAEYMPEADKKSARSSNTFDDRAPDYQEMAEVVDGCGVKP